MNAILRLPPTQPCHRLTLSFGRLYTVTLAERGEVMLLIAYNLHPDHDEWQLIDVLVQCRAGSFDDVRRYLDLFDQTVDCLAERSDDVLELLVFCLLSGSVRRRGRPASERRDLVE